MIKKISIILLILIVLLSFETNFARLVFDEQELENIAERDGLGYKYGNLKLLDKPIAEINKELEAAQLPYSIAIPIFAGIPSRKIQKFLKEECNFNMAAQWQELVEENLPTAQDQRKRILIDKKYPENFLRACKKFKRDVLDAFDAIKQKHKEDLYFNQTFDINNVDEVVSAIKKNDEKLMVRSSGKEDTKKLANAGGNKSVSNVSPSTKEIFVGTGDVVASYFGKKSLTQRLGAGDRSIFDPTPFTPVLIQRMIGEEPNQLPKCGVMFTEEAEGGISQFEEKDEDGKTKTTGITVIQAAYGHNEGIVNSLIPFDTFYVDASKIIYPVIRSKTHRMVPTQERTLELKRNDGDIKTKPALNKEAVLALKIVADYLEDYYKGPMDVEFVVREDEKKIYIVQTRPIVHDPSLPQPSYIANPDTIIKENKATGVSIGVAGGALRWINSSDEIIIAPDIGKALGIYQKSDSKKRVQAIIVGKMAPSTSHEATTFRNEVKPVVYVQNWQQIEEWRNEQPVKLVISPQQALVIRWLGDEESVNDLLETKKALRGWVNYPIPPLLSLNMHFVKPFDEADLQNFFPEEDVNKDELIKKVAQKPPTQLRQLLKILATGSQEETLEALITILFWVTIKIQQLSKDMVIDPDLRNKINALKSYLVQTAQQIKKNIDIRQDEMEFTKKLFPIRFLEGLLFQQPSLDEIIDGYSAATLIKKTMAIEQSIVKELKDKFEYLDRKTIQLLKIKNFAMTPGLAQAWIDLMQYRKKIQPAIRKNFDFLLFALGKLNLLPIWLHTSFAKEYKEFEDKRITAEHLRNIPPDPEVMFSNLINEYTSQANFLNELGTVNETLSAFGIKTFENPRAFEQHWNNFQKNISFYFTDEIFLKSFKTTNNLGKLVAINVMKKFVDTFDLSIKEMKGSSRYSLDKQLENFQTMLTEYNQLFKKLFTLILPNEAHLKAFKSVQASIEKVLNSPLSEQDLGAREEFRVGGNIAPKRREEIFMMIHQSLLVILTSLSSATGGTKTIPRPELLKSVEIKCLLWHNNRKNHPFLVSVTSGGASITLNYNLQLAFHSMQYSLKYDNNLKHVLLKIKMEGFRDGGRWEAIANSANDMGQLSIFNIQGAYGSNSDADITIIINQQTDLDMLIDYIQVLIGVSFSFEGSRLIPYKEMLKHANFNGSAVAKHAMMKRHVDWSQKTGVTLFKALFKRGEGFDDAVQVVTQNIENENKYLQEGAFNLLQQLVHNINALKNSNIDMNKFFIMAIDTAEKKESASLFKVLVEKLDDLINANIDTNTFFTMTLSTAQKIVAREKHWEVIGGCSLLKALVKKTNELKKENIDLSILFTTATDALKKLVGACFVTKDNEVCAIDLTDALLKNIESFREANVNLDTFNIVLKRVNEFKSDVGEKQKPL